MILCMNYNRLHHQPMKLTNHEQHSLRFLFFCMIGEAASQFLDSHFTISDAGSEKRLACCA